MRSTTKPPCKQAVPSYTPPPHPLRIVIFIVQKQTRVCFVVQQLLPYIYVDDLCLSLVFLLDRASAHRWLLLLRWEQCRILRIKADYVCATMYNFLSSIDRIWYYFRPVPMQVVAYTRTRFIFWSDALGAHILWYPIFKSVYIQIQHFSLDLQLAKFFL